MNAVEKWCKFTNCAYDEGLFMAISLTGRCIWVYLKSSVEGAHGGGKASARGA